MSPITEMKNALGEYNIRFDQAEDRIRQFKKEGHLKLTSLRRKKNSKGSYEGLRDLSDTIRRPTYRSWESRYRREGEKKDKKESLKK